MSEIRRLLTDTIDELNLREKRDNRPRFSISFLRRFPWLCLAMYLGVSGDVHRDAAFRNP